MSSMSPTSSGSPTNPGSPEPSATPERSAGPGRPAGPDPSAGPERSARPGSPGGPGTIRDIGRPWIVGALAVVLVLAGLLLWRDRTSVERGNRLFRDGRATEAVEIYRAAHDDGSSPEAGYNLGTGLQELGDAEAAHHLAEALDVADSTTLQRAHYNLGYEFLGRMRPSLRPDSALLFLASAVSHNRQALHRDPGDGDARWNLALAQRSLDSLLVTLAIIDDQALEEVEELEGLLFDSGVLTRADASDPNPLAPPAGAEPDAEEDTPPEDPNQQTTADGAREAREGQDPGPLNREEALQTLRGFADDPELVVRGILWIQRPDVVWWDRTPYPGGDW